MKKTMLIMCVLLALVAAGCEQISVTPEQMQEFAERVAQLTSSVDEYQTSANTVVGQLEQYGIVNDALVTKIAKANEEIDRVQPQVAAVVEAVKTADVSGDDLEAFLKIARAANAASTPFNPYSPLIEGGLGLATILLAYFARRKSQEAAANDLKYQAHKQGVEKTMKYISASPSVDVKGIETELYDNIGKARVALGVK